MDQQDDQNRKKNNPLNAYARFSGIGFQMIAIISLGVYGGVKLDQKFPNKYSLFTITLSLLAIAASLISAIRQVTNFTNKKDTNDKRND